MKTRYKILMVIGSFVAFYFALIPTLQQCLESDVDCIVYQELVLLTRPVIGGDVWGDESGIIEWSGTSQGIEKPTASDYLRMNQNFILSMIVFPCGIIGAIVIWDKRK